MDATTTTEVNGIAAVLKLFTDKKDAVIRQTEEYCFQKDVLRGEKSPASPKFDLGSPIHGSYHVLVPVEAEDVARYFFKVPLDGIKGKWDKASEKSLKTEVETMKSLYSTIPVPYVYHFSETIDNPLGCPFIIISEILGLPLYDVWFGHQLHPDEITREQMKAHRATALDGIAKAMVKLGKFTARKAGAPEFNENGELVDAGATKVVDQIATFNASQDSDSLPDAPFAESDTDEDDVEITIYADCEATADTEKYFTRPLDVRPQEHKYSLCVENFLRLLISFIQEPDVGYDVHAEDRFVLAHPDFNIQNFIVKPDGSLTGIIDWDGVETVPRSVGNLALPGWLTRDWDPIRYEHEPIMDDEAAIAGGYQPQSLWEDSVDSLAEYRDIYADRIAHYTAQGSADSAKCAKAAANICRRSLLTENLVIASYSPVCRANILEKVVSEMWTAHIDSDSGLGLSDEDNNLDVDLHPTFYGIAQIYHEGDGEVDADFENHIREAFNALVLNLERK